MRDATALDVMQRPNKDSKRRTDAAPDRASKIRTVRPESGPLATLAAADVTRKAICHCLLKRKTKVTGNN